MSQNTKTPAMVLHEFTVKHGYAPPKYTLIWSKTGTHEAKFHYQVNVDNVSAVGIGRSKQVAKHDAASKALEILADMGLYNPNSNPAHFNAEAHRNETSSPMKPVNFVGTLMEKCIKNKLPSPQFKEKSSVGPPHGREFTYECTFMWTTTQSTANTKKQAKQLAARDMLDKIKDICPQLAEQDEANASTDNEAIKRYNKLRSIPNEARKAQDFTLIITNIMKEKNVKFEDFQEQFATRTKEGLQHICNTLEVKFQMGVFQEVPTLMYATLGSLDTPFLSLVSLGSNRANAELNLIGDIYRVLDTFMTIP